MPHYYFDTVNGDRDCDQEGFDLPDDSAARAEAIRYFGALLADNPALLLSDRSFSVSVRTKSGMIMTRIEARELSGG